jgi:hypothetical protein
VLSLPGAPCAPKKLMGARSREGAHMENAGAHDGIEESVQLAVFGITEKKMLSTHMMLIPPRTC